jgi:hypothetical protein
VVHREAMLHATLAGVEPLPQQQVGPGGALEERPHSSQGVPVEPAMGEQVVFAQFLALASLNVLDRPAWGNIFACAHVTFDYI